MVIALVFSAAGPVTVSDASGITPPTTPVNFAVPMPVDTVSAWGPSMVPSVIPKPPALESSFAVEPTVSTPNVVA